MKTLTKIILSSLIIILYIIVITVWPPTQGIARQLPDVDTFPAGAVIEIDTPELNSHTDRVDQKADILLQKTEAMQQGSRDLKRETRKLNKVLDAIDSIRHDSAKENEYLPFQEHVEYDQHGRQVFVRDTCDDDFKKHNFWWKLIHLF